MTPAQQQAVFEQSLVTGLAANGTATERGALQAGRMLHVADYGAKFPGQDEGPALQAAINASLQTGLPVRLEGRRYKTKQQLVLPGVSVYGAFGTIIEADAPMDSVLRIDGTCDVRQVEPWGTYLAKSCVDLRFSSYSNFSRVRAYQGKVDGWHFSNLGGGNDAVMLRDCAAELCGTIFLSAGRTAPNVGCPKVTVEGTVSTTANSKVITGNGTHFTDFGLRPGDCIAVGPNAAGSEYSLVDSVDSDTQITCAHLNPFWQTRAGQAFAAYVGDAYHEEISNENNNNRVEHFLARNCAGFGVVSAGLYGLSGCDWQLDHNGACAVRVGLGNRVAPQTVRVSGIYSESFEEQGPGLIWVSNANGFAFDTLKHGCAKTIHMPNPSLGSGITFNDMADGGSRLASWGGFTNFVPTCYLDGSRPVVAGFNPASMTGLAQFGVQAYLDPATSQLKLAARNGNYVVTYTLTPDP